MARLNKVLYEIKATVDASLKYKASELGVEKTLVKLCKSDIGHILKANTLLNRNLDIDETTFTLHAVGEMSQSILILMTGIQERGVRRYSEGQSRKLKILLIHDNPLYKHYSCSSISM